MNNRECSYNKQANRVGPNVDPCGTYKNDMKKMSDNREERLKYRFVVIKLISQPVGLFPANPPPLRQLDKFVKTPL